jgi:hypothetical protein
MPFGHLGVLGVRLLQASVNFITCKCILNPPFPFMCPGFHLVSVRRRFSCPVHGDMETVHGVEIVGPCA